MREVIDKRGAGTADRLLQAVANASLRSLRQIDVVTRYGAHELAALLPNTHLAGALTCADRLRRETQQRRRRRHAKRSCRWASRSIRARTSTTRPI